ncbi:MAG: DNA primase, partial [Ekhidna sp.]|nr:DNA primase [Ekhidna sp.]
LNQSQVKLIRRYSKNITLLFDGDHAGTKASLRGLDILIEEIEGLLTREERLNLNAVLLPEGEDPDSFVRQYSFSDCQEIIEEKRVSWVAFKSQILLKDSNGDPAKLAAAAKEIAKSLSKIKIAVDRELFQKECSIILGISESSLIAEINKNLIQERKHKKSLDSELAEINQTSVQTQPFDSLDIAKIIELQERESVRVLVNYGKNKIQNRALQDEYLIDYFLNEAHEIQFTNQTYRKIVNKFKEKLSEGEIIDGEYFLGHEDEEVRRTVIDLSTEKYELSDNWLEKYQIHVPRETEFLRDVTYTNVLRLKFRIVQQLIQEESKKLKETGDEGEVDELLDDINELKSVSVEIAKILGNVLVG